MKIPSALSSKTLLPVRFYPILAVFAAIVSFPFCVSGEDNASSVGERLSINTNWRFQKGDPAGIDGELDYFRIKDWLTLTGSDLIKTTATPASRPAGSPGGDNVTCAQPGFDDSGWGQIDLPHDWAIEGPFKQEYPGDTGKLAYWGVGWYRRHLDVPASDQGRQIYLDVDGAMSYSTVWLNGQFVGGWPYGYSSYRLDLTPFVKFGGDNVLAIRLDNPAESSRWYPGGGIYRNVWLVKTAPIHVAHWGTAVTTPIVTKDSATVSLRVNVENDTAADASVKVRTDLCELDAEGHPGAALASTPAHGFTVPAGKSHVSETTATVSNPKLWDLQTRHRYVAVTIIVQDDKIVDRYETPFGIRTSKFTADEGFFLNGELVEIKGVCNHHDLGALGTAINTRALERQIEILQSMGCNAIRTSHNPPAPELLDLCDRMGMLVMDESFDCWKARKTKNDYSRLYPDWHERDLRAQVRRDRNHPCVILWSTGNEVSEQWNKEGIVISTELAGIVHEEDPTRPVTVGCHNEKAGFNGFQGTMDVFGFNYKPHLYAKFREANPAIPLFGSETASCVSSRGEYFFPVSDDKLQGQTNFQVSSYDLYTPRWATPPDVEFKGQDQNPFVAGEFVWTGFDYIGEPTPYNHDATNLLNFSDPAQRELMQKELDALGKLKVPSRSSYFGIVDLAGFPKDRFYLYQARWRPDLPMAHILPHWNWPERVGEVTPVHVYTSGDEGELFLNGRSLGRKRREPLQYRLRWDEVKYEPGELRVVTYKEGQKWAEEVMKTTGPATRVTIKADRATLGAEGCDLAYVTVAIADKDGLVVPRSSNLLHFDIEGPAEIVATDNGDATCLEPFQAKERKAFNGLCLVIIRTQAGKPGSITLKATSEGLQEARVVLTSR